MATMSSSCSPYNMKNPAVKRILKEVKELQEHGGRDFWAEPLEVRGTKRRTTRRVEWTWKLTPGGWGPFRRTRDAGQPVRVALRHTWTARHRV
eukprot:scaffold1368_cov333-Pavlova_lutheri.AAC.1